MKKKKKFYENIMLVLLMGVILLASKRASLPASGGGEEKYDVPIIMYHAVMKDEGRSGKYVITPEVLREDIEYILDMGYEPVFISDIINFVYSDSPHPQKPIVLTFDDGYYNNYLYAYPISKEYGIKAVISIIGKHTYLQSESGEKQAESYSHVSWEQLKEMSDSGLWEVGNHTYDMHNTGKKNGLLAASGKNTEEKNKNIISDITKLQDLIKENVGVTPKTFVFPFGSYDENTNALIRDLGFEATLSCIEGINEISRGGNTELLYRYNRPAGVSTKEFFAGIFNK